MDFRGISDTITVIPVVKDDSSNIISVGVNVDSITGPDILVTKLDSGGSVEWQHTYSSAGFNRDQAIAVAVDDKCSIYVAGVLYSSATNFDWVILKYGYDGTLAWTYTLNGTANNYDAPAAIKIKNSFVYVTGEVYDSVTQLNYATIQLNRTTGALNWKREYDFNSLFDIAFAMDISGTSTGIKVAGASQDNLTKWNYCSISYDSMGVANDTTRIVGTNNSFDRPMAARGDVFGNFYITGAASDSGASFNVRTAKIDSAGNLAWVADFGSNGKDDEGNDIIVDDSGYIYVCGKSNSMTAIQQDVVLIKYSNNGTEQYFRMFDSDSAADEVHKMCFDNYGNIVMTGTGTRENADILTLAYNRAGDFLWKIFFNGDYDGQDKGTGIISDAYGNIFVTGEVQITDTTWQQVTIKYKTDYFLVPQDTVPAPSSLLFYPNSGQIIDTHDSVRYDVAFYTINQFPKLYFHQDSISFVMAHVDSDTATTDTLEKITMNFAEGNMANCDPYTSNTHDTDQVLNYFLGHCPDGITGITGSEKIMYSNVYENTDIIFSNNNAGMKFQIIMNPGAEPQAVLHFTGHQSLQLVNNADLQVSGVLGSFIYERPLVYQLDYFGTRISLGWLASYHISGDDVGFILSGNYDNRLPLVVECARQIPPDNSLLTSDNIEYSTYFGDIAEEYGKRVYVDASKNSYVVGSSMSASLPFSTSTGTVQQTNFGGFDAFVYKMYPNLIHHWTTFYGGGSQLNRPTDFGEGVAVNSAGYVYIVGTTYSENIHPQISSLGGNYNISQINAGGAGPGADGFIVKLSNDGTIKDWVTYFGGSEDEKIYGIAIDDYDHVYIVGTTQSQVFQGFPYTPFTDGYNQQYNGPGLELGDGFIARFDDADNLEWCTYFGGNEDDEIVDVIVENNQVFITGGTSSPYPESLTYASTTGCPCNSGSGFPQCDPGTNAYIQSYGNGHGGNRDAFVAEFNQSCQLYWSTYFGGQGLENINLHCKLCKLPGDNLLLSGTTTSDQYFPVHAYTGGGYYQDEFGGGNTDAFLVEFNARTLEWSTLFGANGDDIGLALTENTYGSNFIAYLGGSTSATSPLTSTVTCTPTSSINHEFPLCDNSGASYVQQGPYFGGGNFDGFIAAFNVSPNHSKELLWCTYLGGTETDEIYDLKSLSPNSPDPEYLYATGYSWSKYNGGTTGGYPLKVVPFSGVYNQPDMLGGGVQFADAIIMRFSTWQLVGVDEINSSRLLALVFPNPSDAIVLIEGEVKEKSDIKIELFDSIGKSIKSYALKNQFGKYSQPISIKELPEGFYLAKLTFNNSYFISSKIIKQN